MPGFSPRHKKAHRMVGFFVRAVSLFYCSEIALDSAYRAYFCAKDVAMTVSNHAFSGAGAATIGLGIGNQEFHVTGDRAANTDATSPVSMIGIH